MRRLFDAGGGAVTTAHVTLGGLSLALAAGGFAFGSRVLAPKPASAPAQERQYSDPAEVRAKLERIGRALVLYRQDYPAKPVQEWRNYQDAGLPFTLRTLLQPGRPWSLGYDDIHFDPPVLIGGQRVGTEFGLAYRSPNRPWSELWQANTTRQIVLTDPDMGYLRRDRSTAVLVLRWDGSVEEVPYQPGKPSGWLLRQ
ncbi:MAG: hypothetical protein AB7F50_03185 [Fimbriimonadaceae bacterium]